MYPIFTSAPSQVYIYIINDICITHITYIYFLYVYIHLYTYIFTYTFNI